MNHCEKGDDEKCFQIKTVDGQLFGHLFGRTPRIVANKAFTCILKQKQDADEDMSGQIKFKLVECTEGSKNKEFAYIGERVKLEKPLIVGETKYLYNNKIVRDDE